MTEIRLMNTTNVLRNYGFENGEFSVGKAPIYKLPFKTRVEYGKIEEGASVDTQEEFLTAAYYSPIKIEYKAQAAIDKELPKGREGALKLAVMWLKKYAEYSNQENSNTRYDSALKGVEAVKKNSNLTDAEIRQYFTAYIEKEAFELGKKNLGAYYSNAELKSVVHPIVDYYLNPTKDNLRKLYEAIKASKSPAHYTRVVHGIGGSALVSSVTSVW